MHGELCISTKNEKEQVVWFICYRNQRKWKWEILSPLMQVVGVEVMAVMCINTQALIFTPFCLISIDFDRVIPKSLPFKNAQFSAGKRCQSKHLHIWQVVTRKSYFTMTKVPQPQPWRTILDMKGEFSLQSLSVSMANNGGDIRFVVKSPGRLGA